MGLTSVAEVLGPADLNRALLARQFLLERSDLGPLAAVEQLAGLQSQSPQTMYPALWTRLNNFDPQELSDLLAERQVVRIAVMRSTVHLVSARDAHLLRPVVQPVLDRALASVSGKFLTGVDRGELAALGRELLADGPRTFAALGEGLSARWPEVGAEHLTRAVRTWLSLVQTPPRGLWRQSGPANHWPLDSWAPAPSVPVGDHTPVEQLVLGYLGAFGPATVRDVQHWSGLTRLTQVLTGLGDRLVTFRTADGKQLFDLPEAPRPGGDTPAPVRFLPEFDSLLLSHADRTRVMTEDHRRQVFTVNGIIRATVLVDGRVAGMWRMDAGTLVVSPFGPWTTRTTSAVTAEGRRMSGFLQGLPDAPTVVLPSV